jgi:RNA 2',3'-cyclic 3'-phosphodiesterase
MTDTPAPPLRLFLGIWPPAEVTTALAKQAAAWSWPASARRSPADRLHITLHFIGAVAAARLPELQQALEVPWEGCELVLDRAEVWHGGIAVLEALRVPPSLALLHAALAERLRALSLPVEARRFRPHVTLARKATGAQPPAAFEPVHWPVAPPYLLLQSLPGGRGYVPLQRFG